MVNRRSMTTLTDAESIFLKETMSSSSRLPVAIAKYIIGSWPLQDRDGHRDLPACSLPARPLARGRFGARGSSGVFPRCCGSGQGQEEEGSVVAPSVERAPPGSFGRAVRVLGVDRAASARLWSVVSHALPKSCC